MDALGARRFAVVDVETTGFSATSDAVVEVACAIVQDGIVSATWSTLVNPQRTIPPRATRVHGICDEDVRDAPSLSSVLPALHRLCDGAVVVAHNARFDIGFLPTLHRYPVICTLALSRRAFPNAPNHRNQTLRRYLEIDRRFGLHSASAHRALADTLVTAGVLLCCIRKLTEERQPHNRYAQHSRYGQHAQTKVLHAAPF